MDVDLPNELTQEQIDFLKQSMLEMSSYGQNLTQEPEKLSNNSHEIVFTITGNIMEENEKGEKIKSKHICTKYYHIPVPMDGEPKVFMEAFFKFLEDNLASAASSTYDTTNPYINDKEKNTNG